jgi:hypothetical protein
MSKSIVTFVFLLFSALAFGAEKTDSTKVLGNCGMCKSRIEKAAKAAGANQATWNKASKMLTVTFEDDKTSFEEILKKVAEKGHDSDKFKTTDAVYDALPGCCHYDRSGKNTSSH